MTAVTVAVYCVCSCCNNSRYKRWSCCMPDDHLHWNLLPEKVHTDVKIHHHHNRVISTTLIQSR